MKDGQPIFDKDVLNEIRERDAQAFGELMTPIPDQDNINSSEPSTSTAKSTSVQVTDTASAKTSSQVPSAINNATSAVNATPTANANDVAAVVAPNVTPTQNPPSQAVAVAGPRLESPPALTPAPHSDKDSGISTGIQNEKTSSKVNSRIESDVISETISTGSGMVTAPSPLPTPSPPVLVVQRDWAKKALMENEDVYINRRKKKCLDTIARLDEWTKLNVMNFEDGRMFQDLLSREDLFSNPGLLENAQASDFVEAILTIEGRKGNSMEIGFKVFARKFINDVFKDKARGLALRNFEIACSNGCTSEFRAQFGAFMDAILERARTVSQHGREFIEINRFNLERMKNVMVPYLTEEKEGTYEIEVYCNNVFLPKTRWLLSLLEHNSYCWETVTMMRRKVRLEPYGRLQDYFDRHLVEEYQDGVVLINKLLRDATVVAPGPISHDLVTPLNTSWTWENVQYTIIPIERWHEDNKISEITRPVCVDTMIALLIDALK